MRVYTARSQEDFTEKVKEGDVNLAAMICQAILANLNNPKKNIYILSVELTEEEEIYDLSCSSAEFIVTLERNLKTLEDNELYELCQKVLDGINYLKKKQNQNKNSYEKVT